MRHRGNCSAAALRFDQILQTSLISVVVLVRVKRNSQAFDKLLSKRTFLVFYLAFVGMAVLSLGANFVRIEHGVQSKAVFARTDNDDVLAIMHCDFRYTRVSGLFHCFG